MRIVLAPDKFKGSLTAEQVCRAIEESFHAAEPTWTIESIPMADGGEGTCDLLTRLSNGKKITAKVQDPLFRPFETDFGISGDGKTAFIEMAKASGLLRLSPTERNPLHTTTFGTGQLIASALDLGIRDIVLGIGGSATNDAGTGMASALGVKFYTKTGELIKPTGERLIDIDRIDLSGIDQRLAESKFTVLCDVQNPLHGKHGAAHSYAPQKGADDSAVKILDEGLKHFEKAATPISKSPVNFPGAGASGGLGSGAKVFLHAEITHGFEFVARFTDLEARIKEADIVITGEGKMDEQTLSGKVVGGVAKMAFEFGKPCFVFAGTSSLSEAQVHKLGIKKVFTLVSADVTEKTAHNQAYPILKKRAAESIKDLAI